MPMPNALDVCRTDLFTKEAELRSRYPEAVAEKIMRVREVYNWILAEPDAADRDLVARVCDHHGVHRTTAYEDLAVAKSLLPMMGSASRDFHRWRANEMLMATYRMAEKKKDTKTMERAAASYAKLNRVDLEDEQAMPYEMIVPQPFTATDDPRVLGIEPIPNIQEKIASMIKKYRAETIDIEDVECEDVDLEFDRLFPANNEQEKDNPDYGRKESLL